MTLLNPDMVQEFYDDLKADDALAGIDGLAILMNVNRKNLAQTPDSGNQVLIVNQKRSSSESQAGAGHIMHSRVYISLETTAFCQESDESDARTLVKTVKNRAIIIMRSAEFNGTGWLGHRLVSDRFLGNALKVAATHELVYEVDISRGEL